MITREHPCDDLAERVRFSFVGSSQSQLLKLGKLDVTANGFFWIPPTPLGYHWSIHDADKKHAKGRIHMRLGKGEFKMHTDVYADGQSMGTVVPMLEIPPFSEITGVIPVGAERIGVWVPVDTIVPQLKPFRESRTSSTIIKIDLPSDNSVSLGLHFLLVEKNNRGALEGWLSREQGYWEQLVVESSAVVTMQYLDLFKAPRCWLASAIAFRR